jgi:hypothetical protein
VTLDGQPLPSGIIRFTPADGKTPTADATIAQGRFRATVPPGEKKISISAPTLIGKRKAYDSADSPLVDITQELLPPRYNLDSTLTLSVKAGTQVADFKLESH